MNFHKCRQICLALCAALLLTACGVPTTTEEPPMSTQESGISEQPSEALVSAAQSGFDLPGTGAAAANLDTGSPLYTTGYDSVPYETPAGVISHKCTQIAFGDSFYILDTYYTQKSMFYYFQRLTGSSEMGERIPLSPSMWDIEDGTVLGMDIVDDSRCVFLTDQGRERYHAVFTDSQGNLINSRELAELPGGGSYTLIGCDSRGNLYLDDPGSHDIYLLDSDGKLLQSYSYSPSGGTADLESFRTSDGDRVIICDTPEEQTWLRMDEDAETLKPMQIDQLQNVQKWYGMAENVLYYATNQQLASWNIVTGERKLLSKLDEISSFTDLLDMAVMNTGDGLRLLVTEKNKKERYIISLSLTPPVAEGQIIVANLHQEDAFFSGRVAIFSKENPSYGIQYQALYRDGESDRALLELATGNGPDVLYVSRRDIESLQANGALGDLRQLITQDTMDVLLPGAIQMGTHDDRLSAVPLSVTARTILTNREYWPEDTWTISDIFSALQEQDQLQGLFLDIAGQDTFLYNLYFMVGINIGDSPFIKDGKCGFDCREFRDILTLIKDMSQKAENNSTPEDRLAPMVAGRYLGVEYFVTNMSAFCKAYEKMGDKVNMIGYPSDTGKIYYLSDNGMLAVNQNAMDKDGVRELVNYLLSLEAQQYLPYQLSVRLDIPESQLVYNPAAQTYLWQSPNDNGYSLPAKENGEPYLEEYLDFLRDAVPLAVSSNDIFNIVAEEADSYFQSDKDIDTVIGIIQNRVQIYLDERS